VTAGAARLVAPHAAAPLVSASNPTAATQRRPFLLARRIEWTAAAVRRGEGEGSTLGLGTGVGLTVGSLGGGVIVIAVLPRSSRPSGSMCGAEAGPFSHVAMRRDVASLRLGPGARRVRRGRLVRRKRRMYSSPVARRMRRLRVVGRMRLLCVAFRRHLLSVAFGAGLLRVAVPVALSMVRRSGVARAGAALSVEAVPCARWGATSLPFERRSVGAKPLPDVARPTT